MSTSISPHQALETASRSFPGRLKGALESASQSILQGAPLSEALQPARRWFPGFLLPFLEAAETSGQNAEAFLYLANLCDRLTPILRTVRQLWVIPLAILGFGEVAKLVLVSIFGTASDVWGDLIDFVVSIVGIILCYQIVKRTELGRIALDRILTTTPYVGQAIRAISLGLFFQGFGFIYKAGQRDIQAMLSAALNCVPSPRIRQDLSQIRTHLESGNTLSEAFAQPHTLDEAIRNQLCSGAQVGRLEESLDYVTNILTEQLNSQLEFTKQILSKVLVLVVYLGILGTISRFL